MQILIGCAKTMTGRAPDGLPPCTEPAFQANAEALAIQIAGYTADELQSKLKVNKDIARKNWLRYRNFGDPAMRQPAVFGYDGMVFQKIAPETMTTEELEYANGHLFIGSFLYGLLRPLDLVNSYRLEGKVVLPGNGGATMFDYWKPILTDWFIGKVKADDGILVNLASSEFKGLFDWKRVAEELTVVTPDFKVMKDGEPKNVTIYAKMCRGAMTRWIIRNRISSPEALKAFDYEGFCHTTGWNWLLDT